MAKFKCPRCEKKQEFDGQTFCADCRVDLARAKLCLGCGVAAADYGDSGYCTTCHHSGKEESQLQYQDRTRTADAKENTHETKFGTFHG